MIEEIKEYWEKNLPQFSHESSHKIGTRDWFYEMAWRRFNLFYPYLLDVAEFSEHRGEKVLEIGIGCGLDIAQFAINGAECYGIDITKASIEITKRYLDIIKEQAKLIVANAERLPFKSNTFDYVYSIGVLHHTPNTQKAINEIHRILKPRGRFCVMLYSNTGPAYWNFLLRYIFGFKFFNMKLQDFINMMSENLNCPLAKYYNGFDIKKMFSKFHSVSAKKYRLGYPLDSYFELDGSRKTGLRRLVVDLNKLMCLERWFGENWIIKGKKCSECIWK